MQLLSSSVRVKGRSQPPCPAAFSYRERCLGQLSSPLSGGKAWGTALLHPEARREREEKPWGAAMPSVLHSPMCCLGSAAFCDIPRFRWESRGHPSSLRPPAPLWVIWLLGVQDLAEETSCPGCWQRLWSFFPCDKYGNRVCTRSELGINSIAQIGES